jgi:RHS repeat-associated protein
LVSLLGLPTLPEALAATLANPITYVYDDIGRIEAVIDTTQTNGLATYIYDPLGNLTQITRTAITTTPQIVDFHPHTVATGNPITIYGTGFSSTPSKDLVTFTGGATATATAATQTTATVTVPTSAAAGPIKIKNITANLTSPLSTQSWSTPTAAPVITSMTSALGGNPPKANYGDTVTLIGTGFATNPADDFVLINTTAGQVVTASATQLTFKVPSFDTSTYGAPGFVGSGAVTLRTPNGTATAPTDLIVPEYGVMQPYDKEVRLQPAATQQVTLTSGQLALLATVHATEGQTVAAKVTSGNAESLASTAFDPFGGVQAHVVEGGVLNQAPISRWDGDWLISVTRPVGATGSNTITITTYVLDSISTGAVPTDGLAHTFGCTLGSGQSIEGTFQGTKDHHYAFASSESIGIYLPSAPTGGALPGGATGGPYWPAAFSGTPFVAPETGTYSFYGHPNYEDRAGSGQPPTCSVSITITDQGLGPAAPAPGARYPYTSAKQAPLVPESGVPDLVNSFTSEDPMTWSPVSNGSTWVTDRSPSPLEGVPSLQAPPGETALAGQILALNGGPLRGVEVSAGKATATTDIAGRFLLTGLPAGRVVMTVDARPASTSSATFGVFQIGADADAGVTTTLDYTIWEPALDLSTKVHIDSYPLAKELVITSPKMPGFEVHIPAGSTIVDSSGRPVHDVTLTPVPLDRQPFPAPALNQFTMHFTLQPGDATVTPNGFRVIYGNNQHLPAGFTGRVWTYEPAEGWDNYGTATVTPDGSQVVPKAGLHVDGFQGASLSAAMLALIDPLCGIPLLGRICSADPVDYGSGLFDYKMTDLTEPGTPSISLTRFYRQNDATTYATGLSMAMSYDMLLNSSQPSDHIFLGIPGQQRVTFDPVNGPGTGLPMIAVAGPPQWLDSELVGTSSGYFVRRRDGMRYTFGGNGAGSSWLSDIRDRAGNDIVISRTYPGQIVSILALPSGRWISFTRSGCCNGAVLASASDSAGRTVSYSYSTSAPYRMLSVTDPSQQGVQNPAQTTYAWNPDTSFCSQSAPCSPSPATYLFDVHDRRGNHVLHLDYDSQGRISQQTFANNATQTFDYSSSNPACSGHTRAVDPNGNVSCVIFSGGQLTSITIAQGTPLERTFTYGFDSNNGNVNSVTDSFKVSGVTHTRQTTYTYDGRGNVSQVTNLANTGSPKTWLYTYDLGYSGVTKITDPLSHERRFTYSYPDGCVTRAEDHLSHGVTMTCASTGAVKTVKTDLTGATPSTLTYTNGDLTKVTDPLGNATSRFVGSDGSLRAVTDPLGYQTTLAYDVLGDLTKVTPVSGSSTSFLYDPEQDLTKTTTDSNGAHTDYAYNELNLVSSRTDPLIRQETFAYDPGGNLTKWVDRRAKVTKYCYDAQNDLSFIGYGYTGGGEPACNSTFTSSTSYTYDGAGRLGQVDDSRSGQITRTYDDLDRMTNETTPQGSIAYTYDDANRRSTMAVTGQPQVTYAYFNDDLLKTITRGTNIVNLTYDVANRPATTTIPNGMVETWTYDQASRMTQVDYDKGATHYSTLDYAYDAAGRRTKVWAGFARITLPPATTANATYDLANELKTWNGTNLTYDQNGNIATNGTQTYTFDERNQLTATSGGTSTFKYDGLSRRYEKTVSGTTTRNLYDGPNVVQELNGSNAVTATSITGFAPDQVFWRNSGGVNKNVLTDALGSTLATYNSNATPGLQNKFTYDPYGTPDSTAFPYLFTGTNYDSATGLQYNRSRYYSPALGRFASEDPLGIAGGSANGYLYVWDGPTVFTDPYGLTPGCQMLDTLCKMKATFNGASHHWYIDVNMAFAGTTWGIQFGSEGISFSGGGAIMNPIGGVSVTYSPFANSPGRYCAVQGTYILSYQQGPGPNGQFWEIGVGVPPGVMAGCYVVG